MDILIYDELDSRMALDFSAALNQAYYDRSHNNHNIPYSYISSNSLQSELTQQNRFALIYFDNCIIAGGLFLFIEKSQYAKVCKISHLFTSPSYQGKGIGRQLLLFAEEVAQSHHCSYMQLNVGHIVTPAISLYKKLGYQPLKIYACEPGTFYFIRMIKSLNPYHYSEWKRRATLCLSKIKFIFLFNSDSTPRFYQKILLRIFRK